ncbi:Uncharacterized protein PHSC3_000706 [Chlamydiales bacterium STE3]|nr:Uncharacterized protein PHSC3_000706 [Chlamydiales bacterium STE3]
MQESSKDFCLLKCIENQEKAARAFGFYWENTAQLIAQIQSECAEVQEAWERQDSNHLQEELGDLIQATVSLAIFCNFDPHETLKKSIDKFQKRYDVLVSLAQEDGYSHLKEQPFSVLLNYWDKAKKLVNAKNGT